MNKSLSRKDFKFKRKEMMHTLRKIGFGLTLVVWLALGSSVHAEWISVTPQDVDLSGYYLTSVHFTSPSEGWAVGSKVNEGAGLLHYSNGSWATVTPPEGTENWQLNSVHFTSPDEGWAVGWNSSFNSGVLLHYTDGSWTPVPPPNLKPGLVLNGLVSVHFTSSNEGLAVGIGIAKGLDGNYYQSGVLLHYSNGTWSSVDPPFVSHQGWGLYGVHFTSPNEGWAAGTGKLDGKPYDSGVLLHYSKGSWRLLKVPDVYDVDYVFFISPDEGWATAGGNTDVAGANVVFLHYSNRFWETVPIDLISGWGPSGLHFISSDDGWAAGTVGYRFDDYSNERGVSYHYSNGSWVPVATPEVSSSWRLLGVHFTSSNDGWAVGWDHRNGRGVLLRYLPHSPETVSTPSTPDGATTGIINTSYTYSGSGSSSSLGDPVQYLFSWGDGTDSGWLPVGQTSASKSWPSAGTYPVKVMARCGTHTSIASGWSSKVSVNISSITIQVPLNDAHLDSCSLYSSFAFAWGAEGAFRSYEIQFSPDQSFVSTPLTIRTTKTSVNINSNALKKVMGMQGDKVYWRVAGTRWSNSTENSEIHSIVIESPEPVGNPTTSSTSKALPPSLSWQNNCNTKFKVWFGNDSNFTRKSTFTFSGRTPNDNGGKFLKTLTQGQWRAVRRLVRDEPGSTIYWYVESWDGLGRYGKSNVMGFVLGD